MESSLEKENNNKSNKLNKNKQTIMLRDLTGKSLISALILFGASDVAAQLLIGVTSQKQAIELLKSQGKLLPNVATDFTEYGKSYPGYQEYIYRTYPYGRRARYETNNLKNVNGKNMEIDNDVDSCEFLNITVYKANLDKIVPIIIDTQIDTINAGRGEYERIDRANSRSFIGGYQNKETLTTKTGTGFEFGTHGNAMTGIFTGKKGNFAENDYRQADQGFGKDAVGVRPGKTRLYVDGPATGGEGQTPKALENIYNEAKIHTDKKYIVSYSRGGTNNNVNVWFNKLGDLPNVIIFVPRTDKISEDNTELYAANPSTVEVGYVTSPGFTIDPKTYALSFNGTKRDREVPMDSPQNGKMQGDGFCILGEYATSQSTAFMSAMVANLRAQNPSRTRDEILAILKRDAYKSSEYADNADGWNDMMGYGITQFGMSMKENVIKGIMKEDLFSNQERSLNKEDGKFYFGVPNFWNNGNGYTITGEGVYQDDKGYYIDLTSVEPGTYTYTFWGNCTYEGKGCLFPINRSIEIFLGPESPIVDGLSGTYRRQNDDANTGKIWMKEFKGKFANYIVGTRVDIELNGVKIQNIFVNPDGSFSLTGLSDYPFPFTGNDVDLQVTYTDSEGNPNWTDTKLPISVLTSRSDIMFPDFKIYPNPVYDILNINLPYSTQNMSVKIYNTSGQLYSASNLSSDNNQIDLSSLKPGLYFVTIFDDQGNKTTEKIIKR